MRRETPTAPTADIDEVAHAVQGMQRALDALAAALKQQKPAAPPQGTKVSEVEAKPAADGPTEPPPTNKVEQRIAKTPADSAEPPRSHNSASRNRRPPPPTWDFSELKDDCLLRESEVAAIGRWSMNTVAAWRYLKNHPLRWQRTKAKTAVEVDPFARLQETIDAVRRMIEATEPTQRSAQAIKALGVVATTTQELIAELQTRNEADPASKRDP